MRLRRIAVLVVVLAGAVTLVPSAPAGSLETCAQRVIRDWYSGGRVDGLYPLRCYRAAIRALPSDVLQYSDADRDIARALAYARRGKTVGKAEPAAARAEPAADAKPAPQQARPKPKPEPTQAAKEIGGPVRLASGPEPAPAGGGLPYPIIALALLSGVLFASAFVGWLVHRER